MGWEVGISLFDIFNKYLNVSSIVLLGFPGGPDRRESVCNWGDLGSIPWRRVRQLILVFLSGEFRWAEKPGRLQSLGLQRVRHDLATKHSTA